MDKFLTLKTYLTEKEFHDELDKLLEVVGVKSPFLLVVQVWMTCAIYNVPDSTVVCEPSLNHTTNFFVVCQFNSIFPILGVLL